MLVYPGGETLGSVGGGAIEQAALREAARRFAEGGSALRRYDLSPDRQSELGMICGGQATIAYHFFAADDPTVEPLATAVLALLDRGEPAWLVTVMPDDAPWRTGIWAVGVPYDPALPAPSLLQPHLGTGAQLVTDQTGAYGVAPISAPIRLYVFGGGHVAQALTPLAASVGFEPIVLDDRAAFADPARFPQAQATICADFSDLSRSIALRPGDYAAIMTHGHASDEAVLVQVLSAPVSYVGMIGSRRKVAHTREMLRAQGFAPSDIERVHSPIGLPILAETPAEIAVSIVAELIRYRAERLAQAAEARAHV